MGRSTPLESPLRQPVFWMILAWAALARFIGLFHHSTMPDEAFTFFIASHSLPGIVALLKIGDFHPPLVYLIGHGLFQLTSRAYFFRLVTALFGILGVAATYALARRIIGSWGWIAALLVAIGPVLAFFDGFFRMYAMLWSLAMLSWACLLWCLDEPHRWVRWLAYGAILTGLLYTQYLAFFTLAAQMIYMAFAHRRLLGFWVACAGALAAFVPWLPIFFAQYPLGGTAFNALSGHLWQLLAAPPVLLVDGLPPGLEYAHLTAAVLWSIVGGGLVVALAQRRWTALALFLPVFLQIVYSLASGKLLLGQRYLLQAIVPLVFLVVIFCAWLWSTRLRLLALALVTGLSVMMAAATIDKHFLSSYMPVDWTAYGKFLDARLAPGDGVVFDGSMVYYALVGSKATRDRPLFLVTNEAEAARYGAQAAKLPRVWYIGYQSDLPDPNRIVFKALSQSHPRAISWHSTDAAYGDVVVTTLFIRPAGARGP